MSNATQRPELSLPSNRHTVGDDEQSITAPKNNSAYVCDESWYSIFLLKTLAVVSGSLYMFYNSNIAFCPLAQQLYSTASALCIGVHTAISDSPETIKRPRRPLSKRNLRRACALARCDQRILLQVTPYAHILNIYICILIQILGNSTPQMDLGHTKVTEGIGTACPGSSLRRDL